MNKLTPELKRDLILSIGTHHSNRKLSPIEVAEGLAIAQSEGMSLDKISEMVLLNNTSMITRFLKLLKISPNIKHLIEWGQSHSSISFSTACELAKLKQSEQERMTKEILKYSLSKSEVIQIIQIRERSGKDISTCIEEVLKLRPQVIKKYIFIGSIFEQDLLKKVDLMSQSERDHLLNKIIKSKITFSCRFISKLGNDKFTLVGDECFKNFIKSLKPDFEEVINVWLRAEVNNEYS